MWLPEGGRFLPEFAAVIESRQAEEIKSALPTVLTLSAPAETASAAPSESIQGVAATVIPLNAFRLLAGVRGPNLYLANSAKAFETAVSPATEGSGMKPFDWPDPAVAIGAVNWPRFWAILRLTATPQSGSVKELNPASAKGEAFLKALGRMRFAAGINRDGLMVAIESLEHSD